MSKELKTKAVKFGVKLILKYLGADLLGDATELVAGVGETILPETTKNLLEAFSDTTADFFSDEGGDFAKSYLTKSERYVNFHLARGICKVWENALTDSLPKNQPQTPKPKFTGFHKSFPTVPKYFMGRIGVLEQLEKT